ncbi:MAG: DUF3160 domain-containing protein [Prevotella sp.]|nr:DUF3160 domain-containing protein [Prevotella sp.]
MKKTCFLLLAITIATMATAQEVKPITLPGKGHINVERLNGNIDMNMDISQLSVCELRALRNAFAARQGYLFKSSELRMLFNTTSWYDSLAWERELADNPAPVTYTKQQSVFMEKLKARENELLKNNLKSPKGRVNLDNLINPFQLEVFPEELKSRLQRDGFAIVEADHEQLFQIYEKNDYTLFPSFVTTDLYLQLYHLFFDATMRKVEESKLSDAIATLCKEMHGKMNQTAQTAKEKAVREAAQWNTAYFAIAYQLLTQQTLSIPEAYQQMAAEEVSHSMDTEDTYSQFLESLDVKFPYSLFKPRGHYTRSEKAARYFRSMMWLQTVYFGTDNDQQLLRASLIAHTLAGDTRCKQAFDRVFEPITYIMGTPDNITIPQVGAIMQRQGATPSILATKPKAMEALRKEVEAVGDRQTRIRPKFERTAHCKINFMPQRYQPDAEVLQEMVDVDNDPTKRAVPMGLDVMAALGSTAAERILIGELKQDKRWEQFTPNLERMKKTMGTIDWKACVANEWLATLNALNTFSDNRLPYFMRTPQWDKKNLNATLASWAELKHDAILYAKQPMMAECGDGSLPAPIVTSYVEPNIAFWEKAVELLNDTRRVFKNHQLLNEDIESSIDAIFEIAIFLEDISKRELSGGKITDQEYERLRYIGATFEDLSLNIIKEPDQQLMGWSDVQGTDKSIALVADVLTSNGDNNPEKSILFEAVGPANEIYVIVEVDGYLRLMRGGVFSYREFTRPIYQQRLNDEEWQQMLKEHPNTGKPSWMDEIIAPLKQKPVDNEDVSYGSGC